MTTGPNPFEREGAIDGEARLRVCGACVRFFGFLRERALEFVEACAGFRADGEYGALSRN